MVGYGMRSLIFVAILVCSSPNGFAQTTPKDIEAELEARLKNKVINLKVFPSGGSLRFSQQGNLIKGGKAGSWTLYAGQLITGITIKSGLLRIDGERIIYLSQKGTVQLSATRTGINRYIEVELGPSFSLPEATQALSNIFAGNEGVGPYVPDYWKRYLLRQTGQSTEMSECEQQATAGSRSGSGPTSSGPIEPHVRPSYPDEAKQFRIQGVVALDAVVSETGNISELHVARPVGGGLEESAVEAVRQWKYLPTVENGQPVSVGTCVTVTYEVRQ
jgi:TonB family protein